MIRSQPKILQLIITQVNDESITVFIKSANEVSKSVNFCSKVASDIISKNNQLKLEFDNYKFNQNFTNIQLDVMSTGLREFKEVNKKTTSADQGALLKTRKKDYNI